MNPRTPCLVLACLILSSLCPPAWAVRPGRISHTTEADFSTGQTENTVLTSLGDLKLAAATTLLADLSKLDPPAQCIFDILPLHGKLYIAVGPHPRVICLQNNTLSTELSLPPTQQIFCLAAGPQNQLLVAVSGSPTRILELRDGRWFRLLELPAARYIWDMLLQADILYLATGTEGQLLAVDLTQLPAPQPETPPLPSDQSSPPTAPTAQQNSPPATPSTLPQAVRLILDTPQANLLCLGTDASGTLFVGTDTDGLVYRLRRRDPNESHAPFVLFDAPELEIGALAVLPDGTVYLGTADANQAHSTPLRQPSEVQSGRPLPPTTPPQPPDVPPPIPPQPQPDPPSYTPASESPKPLSSDSASPTVSFEPSDSPWSAQSLDALRQLILQRLQPSSPDELPPDESELEEESPAPVRSAPASTVPGPTAAPSIRPGNAIYRIDPHGFVTEIFRESVAVLSLLAHRDHLLAGTGDQGLLYRLDPPSDETAILANLRAQHISALVFDPDRDRILIGTTNPAQVFALENSFAASGQYTSAPLDANQVSLWGTLSLTAHIPPNTRILLQTRTGNTQDPDHAPWSPWSTPITFEPDSTDPTQPRPASLTSPPARFLQYRLTLQTTGTDTPVVDRIDLAFLTPNLKPSLTAVQTTYAENPPPSSSRSSITEASPTPQEPPEPSPILQIIWQASDPNGDRLLYKIEYRRSDSPLWLLLAQDLTEPRLQWNTRHVPDGRYFIRVCATDLPDNPPDMAQSFCRLSDPILVDNTPPDFSNLHLEITDQTLTLQFTVQDQLSPIQAVHYLLDTSRHWQTVLPQDHLADSTSETFTIRIPQLAPGPHLITLRALDARRNVRYHALTFQVPLPPHNP